MTTFKDAQRSRSKPVARSKRVQKVPTEDQEQITLMSWAHRVKFGNGRLVLLPPDNGAFAPNTLDKLKFLRPTERQTLETKPIFSQGKQYDCSQCYRDAKTLPLSMVVCDTCGNKRCPKALNHRFVCTNSNALNQIGTLAEV